MMAKDSIFVRTDSQNTSLRFSEAIYDFCKFVGTYFSNNDDLSDLCPYSQMWEQLSSYSRGEKATSDSRKLSSKLEKMLIKLKPDLLVAQVYPAVYGSIRYGDAAKHSDIDMQLLVNDVKPKQVNVYGRMESEIERVFKQSNFWCDNISFNETAINVPLMRAVMQDIIDEETTCMDDYNFSGRNFYPYNWVLEGFCPISGLGQIEEDVQELKSMITEAVSVDPLFELMMSLRLHRSISRRKDHLNRV
jgi:predicted nucleotidyltransferase